VVGWLAVKFAVTEVSALTVTVQVLAVPEHPPLQLEKV